MSYDYTAQVGTLKKVYTNLETLRTSANAIKSEQAAMQTSLNAVKTKVDWIATSLGYV